MRMKRILDSEFRKKSFMYCIWFYILVFNIVRFFSPGLVFPLWKSQISKLSWFGIFLFAITSMINLITALAYFSINEKYVIYFFFPCIPVKIIHLSKVVEIGCGKVDSRIGSDKIYFSKREITEYERNNLDSLSFGTVKYIPYREKVYDYLHDVLKLKMGAKKGVEWR